MRIHSGLVFRTYPTVCKRGIDFGDLCQIHVFSLGQWCGFPPGFVAIDGLLCSCSASRELHRLGLRGGSAQSESKHCGMAATPHLNHAEDRLLWGWMAQKDGWGMLGLLGAFVTGWLTLRHFEPHSVSRSVPKGFSHGLLLLKDSETSLSKPQVFKMAAGNLSSTFRFPGIFHSNFQYGGRILKGSSDLKRSKRLSGPRSCWIILEQSIHHIKSQQLYPSIPSCPRLHHGCCVLLSHLEFQQFPPVVDVGPYPLRCPSFHFWWPRFFGLFPMAVNLGLHTAMSVVLCQDWLSVTRLVSQHERKFKKIGVLTFSACWFADGVFSCFSVQSLWQ